MLSLPKNPLELFLIIVSAISISEGDLETCKKKFMKDENGRVLSMLI